MKQAMRVLTSSETAEWYTPPYITDMVRQFMGDIDLDPASCEAANRWIKAKRIYTIEDDGLALDWYGKKSIKIKGRLSRIDSLEYVFKNWKAIWERESARNATGSYHWMQSISTEMANTLDIPALTAKERHRVIQNGALNVAKLNRFTEGADVEIVCLSGIEKGVPSHARFLQREPQRNAQDVVRKSQQLLSISIGGIQSKAASLAGARIATENIPEKDRQNAGQTHKKEKNSSQKNNAGDNQSRVKNGNVSRHALTITEDRSAQKTFPSIGLLRCGNNVKFIGIINALIVEQVESLRKITLYQLPTKGALEQYPLISFPLARLVTTLSKMPYQPNGVMKTHLTVSIAISKQSGAVRCLIRYPSRCWLNPPYGKIGNRSSQDVWARKLEAEFEVGRVEEGCLLTKTVPGYNWWERLFRRWPVCFMEERVKFIRLNAQGEIVDTGRAKAGTSIWYIGRPFRYCSFKQLFKHFGRVIYPPEKE